MRDIFISYVKEDSAITTKLAPGLEAAGHSTWYYQRDARSAAITWSKQEPQSRNAKRLS